MMSVFWEKIQAHTYMFVFCMYPVCILPVSCLYLACILPVFFCFVLYFSGRRSVNASCAFALLQHHQRIALASRTHCTRIALALWLLSSIAVAQRHSPSAGGLTSSLEPVRTASAAGSGQSDDDDTCRRRGRIVVT
jgi:hypothetical protein